ncbi:MAG: type II toxin-antitoxin system RelE/ParE family toxin [Polyangiales bacterium]
MRHRVIWTPGALGDLTSMADYWHACGALEHAQDLQQRLRDAAGSLQDFPGRCRQVPELATLGHGRHRELIVKPYRIIFRLEKTRVTVLTVIDARRDVATLVQERLLRRLA